MPMSHLATAWRRAHEALHTSRYETSSIMYDHQSQAPSTHHAPFNAWLKKALRLNRDPVLFLPRDDIPGARGRIPSYSSYRGVLLSGRSTIVCTYTLCLIDDNGANFALLCERPSLTNCFDVASESEKDGREADEKSVNTRGTTTLATNRGLPCQGPQRAASPPQSSHDDTKLLQPYATTPQAR
jgi:hypothetical protein